MRSTHVIVVTGIVASVAIVADATTYEMISHIVGALVRCVRRSFREPTIVGIALVGILGLS